MGACSLALGGCWGSFGAVTALWHWNDRVSSSKWVKWLVFLGLSIIPVYFLFAMADSLVLNSVEFWTGSNPVKSGSDGRTVTRVATADPDLLRLEVRRHGELEGVVYCRRLADGSLELRDASGKLLSHVHERGDGSLELHGGAGELLARLDASAVERVTERVASGQPVHAVLQLELGERAWQVARLSGLGVTPEVL
ncbi:MAG TPA: DUF3332 family protein [Polyangiaceae bacterium]|nr:DUF3332 family protein [Polyangiaceae bacterium]